MWRSSSAGGSPRLPRRLGMRRLAWSTAITNADRRFRPISRNGGGSSGVSNESLKTLAAAWSVNFRVTTTNLALLELRQRLELRPLERQVPREQIGSEPGARSGGIFEQREGLRQAGRQRPTIPGVDLTLFADTLEARLHHHAEREVRAGGCIRDAKLDVALSRALEGVGGVQRRDAYRGSTISGLRIGVNRRPPVRAQAEVGRDRWCGHRAECRQVMSGARHELAGA